MIGLYALGFNEIFINVLFGHRILLIVLTVVCVVELLKQFVKGQYSVMLSHVAFFFISKIY